MEGFYNSREVDAVVNAVIAARSALGIPTVDVLALVAQRFGEEIVRPDADAQIAEALDELGL